jgi:UDP-N-acetylmuramate dehydrogenase
MDPFVLQHNVDLAARCTMGLGGPARFFASLSSLTELQAALAWAGQENVPTYLLGGGSNVLFADAGFAGLVLHLNLQGLGPVPGAAAGTVRCGAGLNWDALVQDSVARGWAGIECLSGIPGTAGAAPVQNIGAYGQQLSEVLQAVRVVDRRSGEVQWVGAPELALGYRSSRFKADWRHRYAIAQLQLGLRPGGTGHVAYAQVEAQLGGAGVPPTPAAVRQVVLELRRQKGMLWEAGVYHVGSFFLNPGVSHEAAADLAQRLGVPLAQLGRPTAAGVKLSAAWLIERAGYPRGTRRGHVGLSAQHALCLQQDGRATAAELLAFAAELQAAVLALAGVGLVIEPDRVGFAAELGH